MRKLLVTLALAGTLSIPSVVFAEASWYGSLRAGLKSSESKISVADGGSRWGVKGSSEAGEGLTAVYRFEHKMSTENAGMDGGGRLAFVGLSGGFGTVTAGQIWSASYNSFGAVTDNSVVHGDAQTTYRHGNVVSYAFSNDLMGLQLDAAYGGPKGNETDPDTGLQKVEFGLSVNVGDIGKVALAHVDDKYALMPAHLKKGAAQDTDPVTYHYDYYHASTWRTKTNSIAAEISVSDLTVYVGTQKQKKTNTTGAAPADFATNTANNPTFLESGTTVEGTTATHYQGKAPEDWATGGATNHGSAIADSEQKTTFFGIRGGLGDTGINYLFQWRDVKDSHKPWLLGLYKSLGGGASFVIEHVNNDDSAANLSAAYLKVDF